MATEPVVELEGVRFAYPSAPASGPAFELHVPRLRIAPGERVAIIGPSGAGKTTLIHIIAGVLVPEAGNVRVLAHELTTLAERERQRLRLRRIGMVFQELDLLEYLTALENIRLAGWIGGMPVSKERAAQLSTEMGIASRSRHLPAQLSQGERQRVALCRALATEPGLVLCDEPTGNLDSASASMVVDALFGYADRTGATLLMITHDQELSERFSRVLRVGPPRAAPGSAGALPAGSTVSERRRAESALPGDAAVHAGELR